MVVLPVLPGQEKAERILVRPVFTLPGLVPVQITAVLYVTAHNLLYTYSLLYTYFASFLRLLV